MKWAKGSWPPSLPVSGFPGLPQELYEMYFRAVCLSGKREHPSAPASPWEFTLLHSWFHMGGHPEGTWGAPPAAVCPRALCGVWEARARTPGGAHVSVAGRAAPTLQLAWGQSWERLKRAQGAAQSRSDQLDQLFVITTCSCLLRYLLHCLHLPSFIWKIMRIFIHLSSSALLLSRGFSSNFSQN